MGVAITGETFLWPKRTIPFEIDLAFEGEETILDAIAHWNKNTVIKFEPRSGEEHYVRIMRVPGGAVSDVGRRNGMQKVSLDEKCEFGSVIHELGHTVGLWHEHCRNDRDDWVEVNFRNIKDGCEDNFKQNWIEGPAPTEDLGDYDYGSIMHYPSNAFPINKKIPVITALHLPAGVKMGQRDGLSDGDIAAVKMLYAGVAG